MRKISRRPVNHSLRVTVAISDFTSAPILDDRVSVSAVRARRTKISTRPRAILNRKYCQINNAAPWNPNWTKPRTHCPAHCPSIATFCRVKNTARGIARVSLCRSFRRSTLFFLFSGKKKQKGEKIPRVVKNFIESSERSYSIRTDARIGGRDRPFQIYNGAGNEFYRWQRFAAIRR